jgi:hypothetical protein
MLGPEGLHLNWKSKAYAHVLARTPGLLARKFPHTMPILGLGGESWSKRAPIVGHQDVYCRAEKVRVQ